MARTRETLQELQKNCSDVTKCLQESYKIVSDMPKSNVMINIRSQLSDIKKNVLNLDNKIKTCKSKNGQLKSEISGYNYEIKVLKQKIRANQPKTSEKKEDIKDDSDDDNNIVRKIPILKGTQISESKKVQFSMPQIGFGLYKQDKKSFEKTILDALSAGYRHFDGASLYDNEKEFGEILIKNKISRKEIFITSKVWNADQGYDNTIKACNKTLNDLKLKYIDLYLVHWPMPKKHCGTWKAMEKLYYDGKCKNIGLSNYTVADYKFLLDYNYKNKNFVKPCVNQLNINPLYWNNLCDKFVKYFKHEQDMVIQCYKVIERADPRLLESKIIKDIAIKYNITVGQVCMKWAFQKGLCVIAKSVKKERMIENINSLFVKDFEINDMNKINTELSTKHNIDAWYKRYYSRRLQLNV